MTETLTRNADVMPRPKRHDKAVVEFAAHKLAERIIEDWDTNGAVADWVEPLAKEYAYWGDGYKLARELERYHWVTPDSRLVEILDEGYSIFSDAFDDALAKWVIIAGWTPRFAVGQRVTCRFGEGVVNAINAKTSVIYFAPDGEAERYRNGGGYLVYEDELTASGMEAATAGETSTEIEGSTEGDSPTGNAGDAQ